MTIAEFEILCQRVSPYLLMNARGTGVWKIKQGRPRAVCRAKNIGARHMDESLLSSGKEPMIGICPECVLRLFDFVVSCISVDDEIKWPKADNRHGFRGAIATTMLLLLTTMGLFIFVQASFPGSLHDVTCLRASKIATQWRNYFSHGRYLLGDPG
eukprot:TRINITY_DN2502_c0_g1_i2.p1 TRINITY_DN2502_c0_g1~~TRINITY_DN2502_c0_g1_i2.p1  ORF type:complete len:156 (-),score=21.10 TRINITY_DN2502_c0_g1_i2:319-786(-)